MSELQGKHFPSLTRSKRHQTITKVIPIGVFVNYTPNKIIISNNEKTAIYEGIYEFNVYDVLTGYSKFNSDTGEITFEGYGKCDTCTTKFHVVNIFNGLTSLRLTVDKCVAKKLCGSVSSYKIIANYYILLRKPSFPLHSSVLHEPEEEDDGQKGHLPIITPMKDI